MQEKNKLKRYRSRKVLLVRCCVIDMENSGKKYKRLSLKKENSRPTNSTS